MAHKALITGIGGREPDIHETAFVAPTCSVIGDVTLEAGASVWYSWIAPANGTFRFDTAGSGFPALLGVYTGAVVDALSVVRRSDDLGGRLTALTFAATAGTTYRIAVDGLVRAAGPVAREPCSA